MSTIANANGEVEDQVGNKNIARIRLEGRSLFELAQHFAVSGVGDCTPEDSELCGKFSDFGILEILDAPEEKYGPGPHFVQVEKKYFVPRIEFSKLVSKRLQVQTPTVFYGTDLTATRNSKHSRSRLQNLNISASLKPRLLFGTLIGKVEYEPKLKEHLAKLYASFHCPPMVIIPSHVRFANLHTGALKKKFISPFSRAVNESSILLMQTIPGAENPVQLTYEIQLSTDLIIIGQVTMEELRKSVARVYENVKGESDDYSESGEECDQEDEQDEN